MYDASTKDVRCIFLTPAIVAKKNEWEHISDCVDKVLELFDAQNIEYRLDKKDIGTGDKISALNPC